MVFWIVNSDAASGWAGWALAHSEFGSSVNPITTRGADYAHHITASPPGFENPAASLQTYNYVFWGSGILIEISLKRAIICQLFLRTVNSISRKCKNASHFRFT